MTDPLDPRAAATAALPPLTPPLARRSMVPAPWGPLSPLRLLLHRLLHRRAPSPCADAAGVRATLRRLVLLALSLAPAAYATWIMAGLLPREGQGALEFAVLALFAVLSCWVAAGFWTAMMGFLVLVTGGDRQSITRSLTAAQAAAPLPAEGRTAIVMPVCNEDVQRVFAGLRATIESVARTGTLEHFDFFVLSDTSDPDLAVAELRAWRDLVDAVDGEGRVFYRRRSRRVKRKSGNIDDFCRRWGGHYRYMVVLDADSVMSGACLNTLVRLMEARPDAGIIQTAPVAAGRETLHARAQQFATAVYGPLFTAGLHFWQLGESHYWGHNAIIRLAPFIAHCALAPLPGRGALAGEILSHDFVEAALMRRAGYGVWIAWDLAGSFEETPPNLLDELKRDRRWCQGNLMNFRLMFARGIHPVHRAVFLTGALAYLSAPLWCAFLVLSTALLVTHVDPAYFTVPYQLFPLWPSWNPQHAWALAGAVALLLFLPKVLAALVVAVRGAHGFGGGGALFASLLAETLLSALLAPVRMLFHTQFVLAALGGWTISWRSPARADAATPWSQALARHGPQTALGIGWLALVAWQAPEYLWWLLPVAAGLVLSVPLSVLTSRAGSGLAARARGLFVTPAETNPPQELRATAEYAAWPLPLPDFTDALFDPSTAALVAASARRRRRAGIARNLDARVAEALVRGPAVLEPAHRRALLTDAELLTRLQRGLARRPLATAWQGVRGRLYRPPTVHTLAPTLSGRGHSASLPHPHAG